MGDPKKLRKKYETPRHPWQASRIEFERPIVKEYGLKNKKEIWKAQSLLRRFTKQAKSLSNIKTLHEERGNQQLISKLTRLGLLKKDAEREDVLGLNVKDILNRRLQTILIKKGLALSPRQSRQLIVHGHIAINNQKITVPSYLVSLEEENKISYLKNSSFNNVEHAERILIDKSNEKLTKEEKEITEAKHKEK